MFLNAGFSYEWWNTHYGFCYDKSFYLDVVNKSATLDAMDEIMAERFPYYRTDYENLKNNTVSNPVVAVEPFGHRFIPTLFGCDIKYSAQTTPWAIHSNLSDEQVMSMPIWDLEMFRQNQCVQMVDEQAIDFKKQHKNVVSAQNLGSVINTAIYLRENLFSDFYEKPEVIHRLFELITNRMELSIDYFNERDENLSDLGVGNCSVCMISPVLYEKFDLQYDLRIMKKAKELGVRFSMHQDSDVTAYIDKYRAFNYLYSFDVGQDTNLEKFREAFPDVIMNIFVYPAWLEEKNEQEIVAGIRSFVEASGCATKTGISCYDIDKDTEDGKIRALCDAIEIYL